jgi:hypothetical protein
LGDDPSAVVLALMLVEQIDAMKWPSRRCSTRHSLLGSR